MDHAVLHREGGHLWPMWATLAPIALGGPQLILAGASTEGWQLIVIGGLLWSCFVLPLVLSCRVYGRVVLTTASLVVGRHSFDLSDLDGQVLRRQAEGERPGDVASSLGRLGERKGSGGAWGPTLGMPWVLLRSRGTGELSTVETFRPRRLAGILSDAVAAAQP